MSNARILPCDPVERAFTLESTPPSMVAETGKYSDKGIALNRMKPYIWNPEIVRGCNLRCSHCATRLFPPGERKYMPDEIWHNFLFIMSEINPTGHILLANNGEPTLHPHFINFMSYARSCLPECDIELYTNGYSLIDGDLSYEAIFESGVNAIFVDMYHPVEMHETLARRSGYPYHVVNSREKNPVNIFNKKKHSDFRYILLHPNPLNWAGNMFRPRKLSTYLNNLDWEAASKIPLSPVEEAPRRRCDQILRAINFTYDGLYYPCCQDVMRETAGLLGKLSYDIEDFLKFWFGPYMQASRKLLYSGGRPEHALCSRCNLTHGHCDIPFWKPEWLSHYYDGSSTGWLELTGWELDIELNERSF